MVAISGEEFDEVIDELIGFLNYQVGMYMDAMSGFEGHRIYVERQVFRGNRPGRISRKANGLQSVMMESYEDSTQPKVLISRIVKVEDFLAENSIRGRHEQQLADSTCVFIFSFWDEEIRRRLAESIGKQTDEIKSPAFGDLRLIRNAILHNKRIVGTADYRKLSVLQDIASPNVPLMIDYEKMHKLFVALKNAAARLMFEWRGTEPPGGADQVVGIAIQRGRRGRRK
jgi:hypothetical protein